MKDLKMKSLPAGKPMHSREFDRGKLDIKKSGFWHHPKEGRKFVSAKR